MFKGKGFIASNQFHSFHQNLLFLCGLIVFFNLQSDLTLLMDTIVVGLNQRILLPASSSSLLKQSQLGPPLWSSSAGVFASAFCPQQCHCDDPNLRVICSNANLDVVPITLNPNLKELNLNDNHIRSIRKASFSVYGNLESLDLSGNHLNATEDKAFLGQHKLKVLRMERNTIWSLTNETFTGLDSLEVLLLGENRIKNITTSVFKQLKKLETLDLTKNQISYLAPDSFQSLHSLRHLYLRGNRLGPVENREDTLMMDNGNRNSSTSFGSGSDPGYSSSSSSSGNSDGEFLRNRAQGMDVDDDGNHFLFLPSLSSTQLASLVRLDLGSNNFKVIKKLFSPFWLPELEEKMERDPKEIQRMMVIDEAKSEKEPVTSFVSLHQHQSLRQQQQQQPSSLTMSNSSHQKRLWPHLQELYLDGCSIRYIEPGSFNSLGSLLILRIHDNRFEEIPKEALSHLSSLQVLQIGQNPFEKITSEAFGSLTRLKSLDISRCPSLRAIDPFAFVGIDKLQRLELSQNPKLTFLDPQIFGPLVNLRYLSLRGNSLSTLDPRFASVGHQLEILDLRDNPFTCNCSIQWIRKLFIGYRNSSLSKTESSNHNRNQLVSSTPAPSDQSSGVSGSSVSSELLLFKAKGNSKKSGVTINYESLLPEPLRQLLPSNGTPTSSDSHSSSSSKASSSSSSSFLPSTKSYMLRVIDVKCANPAPLRDKLLINLDPDDIGCFEVESMAPIIIALMIACVILFGVIIICAITCRTRLTFLIKGTSNKNQHHLGNHHLQNQNHHPHHHHHQQHHHHLHHGSHHHSSYSTNKFTETVNNNRKLFGLSGTRRVNDLEYHYAKSECIVHDIVSVSESNLINNLNNPYETIPALDGRESDTSSMDEDGASSIGGGGRGRGPASSSTSSPNHYYADVKT